MYQYLKKYGKILQFISALLFMFIGILNFLTRILQEFALLSGFKKFDFAGNLISYGDTSNKVNIVLLFVSMLGSFILTLLGIIGIALAGKIKYSGMCFMFGVVGIIITLVTPSMEKNLIFVILCLIFVGFYSVVSYMLMKVFKREGEEKKVDKSTYEISDDFI